MGSVIKKFQKCGKQNCHCQRGGSLHGPYFWFVYYSKPRNSLKKGKYKWLFIGKKDDEVNEFLKSLEKN